MTRYKLDGMAVMEILYIDIRVIDVRSVGYYRHQRLPLAEGMHGTAVCETFTKQCK